MQAKDGSVKKPAVPKQRLPHPTDTHDSNDVANGVVLENSVRRVAPVANMVAQQPSLQPDMNTKSGLLDAAVQKDIAERASLLLDPALFSTSTKDSAYPEQAPHSTKFTPALGLVNDPPPSITAELPGYTPNQHLLSTSYTTSNPKIGIAPFESRDSFEQPASSLVSPPASSHDDVGNSPTTEPPQWAPSRSSSEQSSTHLKQVQQRYTPESGPMRRASSSSYGEAAPEQATYAEGKEPSSSPKARAGLKEEYMADKESLRLIKELQAQELGLRRREKA